MNLVRQTNTKIRLIGVQGSKILEKLSQKMIKKKGITHLSTSEAGGPDWEFPANSKAPISSHRKVTDDSHLTFNCSTNLASLQGT